MSRISYTFVGAMIASAALAACNAPEEQPLPAQPGTAETQVAPSATPVAAPVPQASQTPPATGPDSGSSTIGGDGSQLILSPLSSADLSDITLTGELACSFGQSARGQPLLLARGDVGDADGRATFAVKIGTYVQQGTALEDGGFDALLDGARFGTQGLVLTVRNLGAPEGGGEWRPRTAELLVQRADGAERVFDGWWTCGP